MNTRNKLRNKLIRRIQQLSTDKLSEVNNLLEQIESKFSSKEKTLQYAGSWKGMDEDLMDDLTTRLHEHRENDRSIEL